MVLARGALPVEVAQQLADSADPGDEVAISTLFRAADALGITDPAVASTVILTALNGVVTWYEPTGRLTAERIADHVVGLVGRMLACETL